MRHVLGAAEMFSAPGMHKGPFRRQMDQSQPPQKPWTPSAKRRREASTHADRNVNCSTPTSAPGRE